MTFQCAVIIISKWFETHPGVAQLGSALDWGSRGRRVKSCHSDHKKASEAFIYKGFGAFFIFILPLFYRRKFRCCGRVVDKNKISLPHFFTVTDRLRTNEPRFTLNSPPFLMRFLTSRFPLFPQAARDIAGRRRNNNSGCIFKIYRTCYNQIPGCRNSRGYVNGVIPTDLSGIILLQYHKNI